MPNYNEDLDNGPRAGAVRDLRAALARADAILIATPEYNHSLPGQLKNALDWASRPFPHNSLQAKPVAVLGASTSLFGAIWAQAQARKVLTATGARVIDEELPVANASEAFEAFEADCSLRDPELSARLAQITKQLASATRQPEATRAPARQAA